jgi:hypothetical protein
MKTMLKKLSRLTRAGINTGTPMDAINTIRKIKKGVSSYRDVKRHLKQLEKNGKTDAVTLDKIRLLKEFVQATKLKDVNLTKIRLFEIGKEYDRKYPNEFK